MKTLVTDFSRVLIFADDMTVKSFGAYYKQLAARPNFKFDQHFFLNTELLSYLRKFSTTRPVYLFSDGGMYKLDEVKPRIAGIFKAILTPEQLGGHKSDPATYDALASALGCPNSDIVFIDDKPANIAAANAAGCQAELYVDSSRTIAFLEKHLNPAK